MNEPKFTPTTWALDGASVWTGDFQDKLICTCYQHETKFEDAKLIAAAPDLYDALASVLKLWDATIGSEEPAIKQARKAVAKARGET